ncbi:hypothetical protein GH714_040804 [Hevea brasiliensis]|uniref:Major facilitator superfamily (MFS) profile domain-containing protein n=1 Tax=Hevea brasiliensis TaxID=3981 RepID=A0A6A6MVM4_HEVBR|nr:hypothetical protein GH714_040804 [Hevea brasiliensis]
MDRLRSKWIATVASILIQCSTGATLTFSIYSSVLKSSEGYNQSELDMVSVFKDIGDNGGILSGLLYTAVTRDGAGFGGPWVVHMVGAIQCFTGYFLMWASVVGFLSRLPMLLMCLYMLAAAHAQPFFDTANVVIGVQSFPKYIGTVVGIMKGFQGLSAAILIQIYNTICQGKPSTFFLIIALSPTPVSLLLMCLVRSYENNAGTHCYLAILLFLLASPLAIAIKALRKDSERFPQTCSIEVTPSMDKEAGQVDSLSSQIGEHMNLFQAIRTLNFWLLVVCIACGRGSGLATTNNVRQVGESLNYKATEINTLVSLWSMWNSLARFGAGFLSDFFLYSRKWARPFLMAIILAIITGGHTMIASGFSGNLCVATFLVGVCNGSVWSLMPTITSEIFRIRHMGTIFHSIAIASPIGTYMFSVRVVGYIYDEEASGERNLCSGTHCFMLSFLIMASTTLFGFLVAIALFL